jgi:alkanesulfonate monooxygenase SsuD/methylene tetrahydromethanopterin reductase-like flavin-dependent oxidoreductase (luciferase family)
MTLDVVSTGRTEFGIGASWLEAEWDAVGLDFASRGRRVDEAIDVCRRLWSDEVVEHHGEFFDFGPVMFEPKPVQQPLPLHIGGDGPAALRRAATVGDGWIPMNHALEQIPAASARLAQLRADAGRAGAVEITLGAASTELDDLRRCGDAGVGRVLVRPWRSTKDAVESLRRFADTTLAAVTAHPVAGAGG